ncbi:MAG: hypothetical protein IT462_07460 [Planctomycetes bacterium]|nr:hypothetical protein [Planctomycetota bacterium]
MHLATKILIITNLVFCLVLSQYVWIALAGNVQWREKYQWEADARRRDKNTLEQAYAELFAQQHNNDQSTSNFTAEAASLNATKRALEAWAKEAELAKTDAMAKAEELEAAVLEFPKITQDYHGEVIDSLQRALKERSERKKTVYAERGNYLRDVAQNHTDYATLHEDFVRLEFQQYLLQEELERRLDTKARYRRLRPDIQADLGENGPVIYATVQWASGMSIQLDKGKRNGVELHQKYTITRGGATIAIADVVEVQNETCQCMIVDTLDKKNAPKSGDEAVTRLFMARVGSHMRDR